MGRVLVVEDDPDILSSLAEVIREDGYEVETAANGYQALEHLSAQMPDLIFLDLMMPGMDGCRFLEEAHHRFPEMQVPVVLLSAASGLSEKAARLGIRRYLPKPFELENVTQIAHEYCPHIPPILLDSDRPV